MNESEHWLLIPTTFLLAMVLTLLPMPAWAIWFRPAWILMVLIYWVMMLPHRVNVGVAWFIGIILDVLNGTLLGEHALAFTVATYFVARLHSQLRMYPLLQQSLWVFIFVLLYQFILFCIQGFLDELPKTWLYWSSSVISMILWPWISMIMRDYHRRFKIIY